MKILTDETLGFWRTKYPRWWVIQSLLPEDISWIEENGKKRNHFGKSSGWTTRTPDSSDLWHVSGLAGEWATALVLNIPISRITGTVKELNDGDLGARIEVRTSVQPNPWAWSLGGQTDVIQSKLDRIWVHCISALYPKTMIVTGWAYGDEIMKTGVKKTARHSPTQEMIMIEQPNLRPIEELLNVLRK